VGQNHVRNVDFIATWDLPKSNQNGEVKRTFIYYLFAFEGRKKKIGSQNQKRTETPEPKRQIFSWQCGDTVVLGVQTDENTFSRNPNTPPSFLSSYLQTAKQEERKSG